MLEVFNKLSDDNDIEVEHAKIRFSNSGGISEHPTITLIEI